MPRSFDPKFQCEGKICYHSKKLARIAARRSEQAYGRMHPYRCAHCGWFHIGHKPQLEPELRLPPPAVRPNWMATPWVTSDGYTPRDAAYEKRDPKVPLPDA